MDQGKRINVYFISGLGADERVFSKLNLPEYCSVHHLRWIPFYRNETLVKYAKRLSEGIDTSFPFIIIGLSLGGMLAVEMKQFLKPQKVILISSAQNNKQLPLYYRWIGGMQLHKLVPVKLYKFPTPFLYWYFGIKTAEEKKLFDSILEDADPVFVKHAINGVLHWKRRGLNNDIVHIHGTKDKVLPVRNVKPTHVIPGGEHLMVYSRAKEVSEIISKVIENLSNDPDA